jgi:leucyl-tRNA synthetase
MYAVALDKADDELKSVLLFCLENVLLLLSPILPHFCEELFEKMGRRGSVLEQAWPEFREDSLKTDEVLVVVQVNGKLRSKFNVGADDDEEAIKAAALADEKIIRHVQDKPVRKIIVIRKKTNPCKYRGISYETTCMDSNGRSDGCGCRLRL